MPRNARIYVGVVIGLGLATLAVFVPAAWEFPHAAVYLCFLTLALLAAALKVRLPGVAGTMSVSFVFILVSVAEFTRPQTIIMAALAGATQSLWRPRSRRRPVQVLFNAATLVLSAGLADFAAHAAVGGLRRQSLAALLVLAATMYFVTNSLLVAGVLALVEARPLRAVWRHCYLWSFPYYLTGAAIAGFMSSLHGTAGWGASLLLVPAMYLIYFFYRMCLQRAAAQTVRVS